MPKFLILGAGASHGHGADREERPPFAGGFFASEFEQILSDYSPLPRYINAEVGINPQSLSSGYDIEELWS